MGMIGNIVARVGADVRPLQQGLSSAQRSLGNFQRGATTNTSRVSSGMIAMGNIAATAFMSIASKIAEFSTDSIKSYNDVISSNMGLQSILEAQGKSFSQAQTFINSYIEDGLVPLQDATTAYKNLVARGYDDKQIGNLMNRLKDAASFGRQSGLSIGEAVRGAAEGLRAENSMLVDNAGITKNVAKMWEDYATTIGTTRDKLTMAQKRLAEYNGTMEESKFQVGDAARYSGTLGGQMAALSAKTTSLSAALGSVFAPMLQAVLPYIMSFVSALTAAFTAVGQFMSVLFGTNKAQTSTAKTASTAQTKLGDATKKAGDKAKKGVAGFDEINQLQEDIAKNADDATSGVGDITTPKLDVQTPDLKNLIPQEVLDMAARLKEKWGKPLQDLKLSFKDLLKSMEDFWNSPFMKIVKIAVAEVLENFANGALKTLTGQFQTLSGLIKMVDGLFNGDFNKTLKGVEEVTSGLYDTIEGTLIKVFPKLEPILDSTKKKFTETWTSFKDDVKKYGDPTKLEISDFKDYFIDKWDKLKTKTSTKFGELKTYLSTKWDEIKSITWDDVKNTLITSWTNLTTETSTKWDEFKTYLSTKWEEIKLFIGWDDIKELIITSWTNLKTETGIKFDEFKTYLSEKWEELKAFIGWDDIKKSIVLSWVNLKTETGLKYDELKTLLQTKWDNITSIKWSTVADAIIGVWEGLSTDTETIWDGMKTTIKNSINSVVGLVNSFISKINSIEVAIPTVSIPGVGTFGGYSLKFPQIPSIPALANGGITTGPTLAQIGEAGTEAVIPLENSGFVDMLASAIGSAVVGAMQFGNNSSSGNKDVVINVDSTQLARVMIPAMQKENQRIGNRAIIQTI